MATAFGNSAKGLGDAEFSMRDLAAEEGASFETPFNQFGSIGPIIHALSARRIDAMMAHFATRGHARSKRSIG
jgi:hypothetical protein